MITPLGPQSKHRIKEDLKTVANNFLKVSHYAFEGNRPKIMKLKSK